MVLYQLATKAQALAMKVMGATLDHIERITEIKRRTLLQYLFKRARSRGWDPSTRPLVLDGYIIVGLSEFHAILRRFFAAEAETNIEKVLQNVNGIGRHSNV
jgi:hypothetical protein